MIDYHVVEKYIKASGRKGTGLFGEQRKDECGQRGE